MKIQQIEQSLNELKEEDQIKLKESLENITYIQTLLREKENILANKNAVLGKYKMLDKIKKDKIVNIYIVASLFEVPISIVMFMLLLLVRTSAFAYCTFFILAISLFFDGYRNFYSVHSIISYDQQGVLSKIHNELKELISSKKEITRKLEFSIKEANEINQTIEKLKMQVATELSNVVEYKEELTYLEGCLIGITKVIEKNLLEEFPDTNEVVYYVNRKLEKKKR